jgi:hypothetical protein
LPTSQKPQSASINMSVKEVLWRRCCTRPEQSTPPFLNNLGSLRAIWCGQISQRKVTWLCSGAAISWPSHSAQKISGHQAPILKQHRFLHQQLMLQWHFVLLCK